MQINDFYQNVITQFILFIKSNCKKISLLAIVCIASEMLLDYQNKIIANNGIFIELYENIINIISIYIYWHGPYIAIIIYSLWITKSTISLSAISSIVREKEIGFAKLLFVNFVSYIFTILLFTFIIGSIFGIISIDIRSSVLSNFLARVVIIVIHMSILFYLYFIPPILLHENIRTLEIVKKSANISQMNKNKIKYVLVVPVLITLFNLLSNVFGTIPFIISSIYKLLILLILMCTAIISEIMYLEIMMTKRE